MIEQPKWYHCKMWKMLLRCDANNSQWGYKRALNYKQHEDGHYCSWTDEEHNIAKNFKERMDSGELGEPIRFDTVDEFVEYMKS